MNASFPSKAAFKRYNKPWFDACQARCLRGQPIDLPADVCKTLLRGFFQYSHKLRGEPQATMAQCRIGFRVNYLQRATGQFLIHHPHWPAPLGVSRSCKTENTSSAKLTRACRGSIQPQVDAAKAGRLLDCDHTTPGGFAALRDAWLAAYESQHPRP